MTQSILRVCIKKSSLGLGVCPRPRKVTVELDSEDWEVTEISISRGVFRQREEFVQRPRGKRIHSIWVK